MQVSSTPAQASINKTPEELECELLDAGLLPPRLQEVYRILPYEDPIYEEYRSVLTDLLTPYATAEELDRLANTRLTLSRSDSLGFAYSNPKAPMVCLGYPLLDEKNPRAPKNLDALIGIIVHEFAHIVFQECYPHEGNGEPEEALADIIAVQVLYEKGLDPRAYLDYMRSLIDPDPAPIDSLRFVTEVIDEHPFTPTRVGYISAEITRLEQTYGEIKVEASPMPEPNLLNGIAEKMRKISAINQHILSAQITALADFVESSTDWNSARQADFEELLSRMILSFYPSDTQPIEIIDPLADVILDRILNLKKQHLNNNYEEPWFEQEWNSKYRVDCAQLFEIYSLIGSFGRLDKKHYPSGKLRPLANLTDKIVSSTDPKEQANNLEILVDLFLDQEFLTSPHTSKYTRTLDWPAFPLPSEIGEQVAWQAVLEEGIERAKAGNCHALAGLILIGAEDPRIYAHLNDEWTIRLIERGPPNTESSGRYSELHGFSAGDSHKKNFSYEYEGKEYQGEETIYFRSFSCDPDGRVTSLPECSQSHYDNMAKHATACNEGMYRENLIDIFYDEGSKLVEDFDSVLHGICKLEAVYGSTKSVRGLQHILSDVDRFKALNANILDQREFQEAVCTELSKLAGVASSADELTKVKQATEQFILSAKQMEEQRLYESMRSDKKPMPIKEVEPYIEFKVTEQHQLFSREEKLLTLNDKLCNTLKQSEVIQYRKLFSVLFPDIPTVIKDWDELAGVLEKLRDNLETSITKPIFDAGEERANESWTYTTINSPLRAYASLLMDVEAAGIPNLEQATAILNITEGLQFADEDSLMSVRESFLTLCDKELDLNSDPQVAVNQWLAVNKGYQLLPANRINIEAEKILALDAWTTTTAEDSWITYAQMLESGKLSELSLIEETTKRWCQTVKEMIGVDDGTEDYRERLKIHLEQVDKFSGPSHKYYARTLLAKTLVLQKEASLLCENVDAQIQTVFDGGFTTLTKGVDTGLEVARRNPEAREDIINFLCNPLSTEDSENLLKKYEEELFFGTDSYINQTAREQKRDHTGRITVLEEWHKNFWSLPIEARAVVARELLIPSGQETEEAYEHAFEVLFDKICPPGSEHYEYGSKFLRTYIEELPEHAAPIFLGALLVATSPSVNPGNRFGKSLALLAGAMGPIENKVIQGAHSHHGTPESIRPDLADSKTLVDEPPRWELFEIIESSLPEEVRDQIEHVGDVVGAASFFISVKVTLKSGETVVLQLLRPHAIERAELGLKRLRAVAEKLAADNPAYQVMIELCEEAEMSFRSEVNLAATKLKMDAAQNMYNKTLEVQGHQVPISTCSLIQLPGYGDAVGQDWRMISYVDGIEFSKLAKDPDEETAERLRINALALCDTELGYAISGEDSMDDDWHGGNVILTETGLGRIDPGSITLTAPTEAELSALGKCMNEAVASYDQLTGSFSKISQSFLEELRKLRQSNDELPPLLRRFQKSLLVAAEYERFFKPGDHQWLLQRLMKKAHPKVIAGMLS